MKTCRKGLHQYEGRQCKECQKITYRNWCGANREIVAASKIEWRQTHLHQHNQTNTLWRAKNSQYMRWHAMIDRCTNPANPGFNNYGGRGITVCAQWVGPDGYQQFVSDMGPQLSTKHQIDRKNNDGNYEPDNCRWATPKEQLRNTRINVYLTHNGVTKCVKEWAESTGINPRTLYKRLSSGWTVERALTAPINTAKSRTRKIQLRDLV